MRTPSISFACVDVYPDPTGKGWGWTGYDASGKAVERSTGHSDRADAERCAGAVRFVNGHADNIHSRMAQGYLQTFVRERVATERHRRAAQIEFADNLAFGRVFLAMTDDERRETLDGVQGDRYLPYVRALDALECLGERSAEVSAERAKHRRDSKLGKSPWSRKWKRDRDRVWLAKLARWFPDHDWCAELISADTGEPKTSSAP